MTHLLLTLATATDLGPECQAPPDEAEPPATLDADALAALEAWSFPTHTTEQQEAREGIRTDGLLIQHRGELIYERYANTYDETTPHLMWSATKTFTNALVGIAVREGVLSVEDSICDHLELANAEHCDITVRHLMEFSSGLDWRETYEGDPPTTSTVIAMLYGAGRHDMAAYVASTPRRSEPGSSWQYSSGDTNLLAAVVQAAMAPKHGVDFPWDLLFEPLGMDSVVWERDDAGTLIGSSYGFATPRDLARFGTLFANDGCHDGERILPDGWIEASTTPAASLHVGSVDRGSGDVNGWQLWLNVPIEEQGETRPVWTSVPTDTFSARGHWKQAVIGIPSADLVIVRTGDDRDGSFSWDTLIGLTLEAVGHDIDAPDWPMPGPITATQTESESRKEDTRLLGIATAYGAHMGCSCAYVMERDEDFCRTWIRASPDIVGVKFDDEERTVTAKALGMKKTSASWRSEREGCTLDP